MIEQGMLALQQAHNDLNIHPKLDGGTSTSAFDALYSTPSPIRTVGLEGLENSFDSELWDIWNRVGTNPTTCQLASRNSFGLPSGHAYSAIRCDQGTGMVILRNPWGIVSQDKLNNIIDRGDGVFDMHFNDWKEAYGDIVQVSLNSEGLPGGSRPHRKR